MVSKPEPVPAVGSVWEWRPPNLLLPQGGRLRVIGIVHKVGAEGDEVWVDAEAESGLVNRMELSLFTDCAVPWPG